MPIGLLSSVEFDREYPEPRKVNLNPPGHQVVVLDGKIALRAGFDWHAISPDSSRLYIATVPGLVVFQQRFLDSGGYRRSTQEANMQVLPLTVNKSYSRGVIRIHEEETGEESILFYAGGARYKFYSYRQAGMCNAPHKLDLEEALVWAGKIR